MIALALKLGRLVWAMAIAILIGSLGHLLASAVPVLGALAVAKMVGFDINISYAVIGILAVCSGAMRGVLRYFEQYFNHYIAFKLLATLRNSAFSSLRALDVARLESKKKGGLLTLLTADIETLETFYAHTLSPICIALLTSITGVVVVWSLAGAPMALVTLLSYLLVGVVTPYINHKSLNKTGAKYRDSFSEFNASFLDDIKGIREIVAYNAKDIKLREMQYRASELVAIARNHNMRSVRAAALTNLTISMMSIIALTVVIVSIEQQLSSMGGVIIGFVVILSTFGPVASLSALPSNLAHTFKSASRVLDLLSEMPDVSPVANGENIEFEYLDVKNLACGYKDKEIIKDATFSIKKGQTIALIGESGSGKTTILKALLRIREKNSGDILYNGIDISSINTDSLLDNVTLINQTPYIFDDTIEYNLKVAAPDATQTEIEAACARAAIHDLIIGLPQGYLTRAGMQGSCFSSGERKRIGLARAFLRKGNLILLDEPTSNVDAINEGIILSTLKELKKEKAVIIVSHNKSVAAFADIVLKLENGVLTPLNQD
jgi:ATP-binding cassette subfamily C protein